MTSPSKLRNFLDWLKVSVTPALVIPVIMLAGYHLMWLLAGTKYDLPSLIVMIAAVVVADVAILVARMLGVSRNSGTKAFLFLAGITAVGFAVTLYLGKVVLDAQDITRLVSVLTLSLGLLIVVAASGLHPEEEPITNHPKHVEQREVALPTGTGHALVRTFRNYGGRGIDRILATAETQISTADLHYVAYHVDGLGQFSIDVMDHQDILTDDKVSSDQRRAQYLRHGIKLNRLMVGLNNEFRSIDSGILLRVVLDVERGALYYFWVDEARFLIGVTLDQSQVHKADAKMVHLVDAVRPLLGHKRIEDLNR
jgi:hypothetical protein